MQSVLLWIAFKLYFIDLWHSWTDLEAIASPVVNCFQIVFYRSLTQWFYFFSLVYRCCELLSNCILSIFDTVSASSLTRALLLWIAFKLYFIDLWHSEVLLFDYIKPVVNCFQIVFYRSLTQYSFQVPVCCFCCELLSNCILSIFDTVASKLMPPCTVLWIAFKLYFIDLWHSCLRLRTTTIRGCELLSNCILSIFDTVEQKAFPMSSLLWIAFKLYFIDLWHSLSPVCSI